MKKIKIAILISGRGSNMRSIIDAKNSGYLPVEIVLVLSNNKDALGLEYAKANDIETFVVDHRDFKSKLNPREEFDKEIDKILVEKNVELICLAGFMRLLSFWFVKKWENKIINIHPSFLPDFKGADAVGDAVKAKAKSTGCTVHFVDEEMDSGPIILQERVDILDNDTKETLAKRILEIEHKIYVEAIKKLCLKTN